MEFKAKRKDLKIDIEGVVYEIKSPKMSQFEELQKLIKDKPAEELFLLYKEWLISLGLPTEALEELDKDDFLGLVQFVTSPSKK